jgi:luciferase family oxidoreductase group 1
MIEGQEHIAYSLLELAVISRGSTTAETFKNSLDLARKAEALGYTRFWLAEHHNTISIGSSATPVLIGYIAEGTQTIRVGSGGVMLPNHSPLIVAEQFATLATLYPGRIDLGLGRAPGTDQETARAIRQDRMISVHHFPEEIGQIQQYFSVDNKNAKVRVPFAEGVNVPIYILGSSTDSAHLAAQKGLPYAFASHFAPAQLMEALSIYQNEFRPSEYLSNPYSIACINVLAADTDTRAEQLLTSLVRMFLNILTGKSDYLQPPDDMTSELREVWQHPNVQSMLRYSFYGSKQTIKQQTASFLQMTGVDELMVVSNMYEHAERVRSYEIFAEVMQELQTL